MEKVDMKAALVEEFKDDPIYRLVILNGLEDYLFTSGILSMHKDLTYSTVQTGKIIERSDSTIRNHFRSDLIEYIAPEKFGKYYRMNYQSIFRLQMIFLLMERASKTTVDILAELGMQPGMSMTGNVKRVLKPDRSESREVYFGNNEEEEQLFEERFEKLEHAIGLQGLMLNILKYEKDLADLDRKIEHSQSMVQQIGSETRMKFLEEKQSRLLASSLKKSIKKQSIFGLFKKNDDIDINQIAIEIDENLKDKFESEIKSKSQEFENKIKEYKQERKAILDLLIKEKNAFSEFRLDKTTHKFINEPIKKD
jgi:hypothetical protein